MNDELFPPYHFLYQVASQCCEATALYLDFWKRRDSSSDIYVKFPDICEIYCMSRTRFHNLTMSLARCGVVEFAKEPDAFRIRLVEWREMYDEFGQMNMLR